jgi:glycosyltransferase involved in cell wall biosynthesis
MRIVHLVDNLGYGGAQQIVADLAVRMQKLGHSVRIVCLRQAESNPLRLEQAAACGVDVIRLDKPPGFHVPTLRKFRAYLESERIEVVHSHNHLVHHYAAFAGRLAATPVVLNTLHGTATLVMPGWAKALFWASCLLGDRVVSVCPEVDQVFRSRFPLPRSKYAAIDNGVDLSRFMAVPRRASGGRVVFGTVGRLVPVKNHRLLIQAFARVLRGTPAELRILGDGPDAGELRGFARESGVGDSVAFLGASEDVPGFLADIDIFVLSSDSEGLPLSLLEAIAAGLPAVATAVGGVPGVMERSAAGWICPPGDAPALAAAMEMAVRHPDRVSQGEQARGLVGKWYSVERMASDYEVLYGQIAQT